MKPAKVSALGLVVVFLLCTAAGQAQFWKKKAPAKWSLQECARLRRPEGGSPWASTSEIGAKGYHGEPLPGESMEYVATISSAWTIQRSNLCAVKLTEQYRRLPAKDQIAVDQQYLKQEFPDTVVFRVDYRGTQPWFRHSSDFWKAKTQDELIRLVTLVIDGERIQPLSVVPRPEQRPWGGLQVVFPRQIEGRPLFTPDMKEVFLEVADPNEKVQLRFEPRKMVVRGELVY